MAKTMQSSRVKKTKDPRAPKKSLSAYFLWLKENRERIQKANTTLKPTEILKLCGREWSTLEDKTKWESKAAEDKARYLKEVEEYKEKSTNNQESE